MSWLHPNKARVRTRGSQITEPDQRRSGNLPDRQP
jgi:hypothetical protein